MAREGRIKAPGMRMKLRKRTAREGRGGGERRGHAEESGNREVTRGAQKQEGREVGQPERKSHLPPRNALWPGAGREGTAHLPSCRCLPPHVAVWVLLLVCLPDGLEPLGLQLSGHHLLQGSGGIAPDVVEPPTRYEPLVCVLLHHSDVSKARQACKGPFPLSSFHGRCCNSGHERSKALALW